MADLSQEELCDTVKKINCQTQYASEPNEIVCASNGETYPNRCFFGQAKCSDETINIVCQGNCTQCADNSNRKKIYETKTTLDTKTPTEFTPNSVDIVTAHLLQEIATEHSKETITDDKLYERTTENNISRVSLDHFTTSMTVNNMPGRKLEESTNRIHSISSTDKPIIIAAVKAVIQNGLDKNNTRVRKDLPGHHVDQSTDTTAKVNPIVGGTTVVDTTCKDSTCRSSSKVTIGVDCVSGNCSFQNNSDKKLTPYSMGTTLPNVLKQATDESVNRTINSKRSTLLNFLTTTKKQSHDQTTFSTRSNSLPLFGPATKKPSNRTDPQSPSEVEIIMFCADMDGKTCPETLDPLCGTNNVFYLNICTFNKAKCKDKSLKLQADLSSCRQPKS